MLRPLLSTWYKCAQQLGDVELSVKLLVELLGHGKRDSFTYGSSSTEKDLGTTNDDDDDDEPEASVEKLLSVLRVCSSVILHKSL